MVGGCQTHRIERGEPERRYALAERERRRPVRREARAPIPARQTGNGRGGGRRRWLLGLGIPLLTWVLAGLLLRGLESGEVLSGTTVAGVGVGGETREGAAELIAGIEPITVELEGPRQSFTVKAPQAGLTVDAERSAEAAYSAGREGVAALLGGPLSVLGAREVEPIYDPVDSARLRRTVTGIAERVDREPFVGALSIDRGTLEVAAEQPEAGVRVRRGAARRTLLKTFRAGGSSAELPVREQPAPSASAVQSVAWEAARYLRRPLRIDTAGEILTVGPKRMARLLAIESTGGGAGIRLGADRGRVESLVADLAGRRDKQPRDARLDSPSQPPVTLSEQGDLTWSPKPGVAQVKPARHGRRIRQGQAVNATIAAVRSGEHQARFTTERVAPDVGTEAIEDASSLLGTFTTSYSCCEPRVTNIQRMAATVDGTVIGPGEQFSLNGIAGERTKANGYKPAPTIGEGNELIDTVGGGVSQFSTTTYNAAYFAGLQIDAHTPHSFYISRYPPGRESTLNFGSIDLLWTNDTKAPVTVRASASDTSVTVSIFGGNGGRRVRAVTQSRADNGKGGFDITIDRVIRYGDGSREREPYTTSYGTPAG